jgi:hypothetical protein
LKTASHPTNKLLPEFPIVIRKTTTSFLSLAA